MNLVTGGNSDCSTIMKRTYNEQLPPELGKHKNGKQHNGNSQNVKTKIRQIHKMSKPQNGKCIKRQNLKMAKPQNGKTQMTIPNFFRIYRSLITVN